VAEIHPFRGVHYNQQAVKDLSAVICPPYDIITPQMEQELHDKSPYNFIRLELPRGDDKYARSAAVMEQWFRQGVLVVDEVPAIYLHDHYFTCQGREYRRRGIIVCVRLEEWDRGVIRPHEGTLTGPKDDRLNLLWALQANSSPILALFEDRERQISSLLAAKGQGQPIISLSSTTEGSHNIWAITEPEVINQIGDNLARQPLYIADGHHRYESALTYRRERQACSSSVSASAAFNFVMMTLVDFSDPGLMILPPHRLIRGVPRAALDGLLAKLKSFFEVEELPLNMPGIWQQVDDLLTGESNQPCLVVLGLAAEHLHILRLRDFAAASQMMPYFHSELYSKLAVCIADHVILEKLLGVSNYREEAILAYSYDRQDTVDKVLGREYQLAFLLGPVKPELVKAIADAGDRMPRKSTYFYPKTPAGLVSHRLV